jgi:ribonucleoside-diphosphate reductase alpha chain
MHFPTFKYAIRRIRVGEDTPICKVLIEAGVPHEKDHYSENTMVFEFPIDQGKTRKATEVSAWEQFAFLAMLQREWSDNMVSCTVYFDKEKEGDQIAHMLAQFAPVIKSVSMLPHTEEGAYEQMPYEGITKEEYEKRLENLKEIDWSSFGGSDGEDSRFCTTEGCEIENIHNQ